MTLERLQAQRAVRIAACIGVYAPIHEYLWFVNGRFPGFGAYDKMAGFFWVTAVFAALAILLGFLAAWFLALPVLALAASILRFVFGRQVPKDEWLNATFLGLWPLPYASALGVALWLVHSSLDLGGWPGDVIFGSLGNAVGAWCYVTIFVHWHRARRRAETKMPPTRQAGSNEV